MLKGADGLSPGLLSVTETVSTILVNQARSTTPPALSAVLIVTCGSVLLLRLFFIRTGRPQLLVSALLGVMTMVVLVRDTWVQGSVLEPLGVNLATARVIGHSIIMYGAVCLWLLARSWTSPRRFSRVEITTALVAATGITVWLWFVSAPARASNVAVEDFQSWRTAAYLVPMSLPIPVAAAAVISALLAQSRDTSTNSKTTRLAALAAILAAGLQFIDHVSRAVSAVFLSIGEQNWLTHFRTQGVDQVFLPAAAALAIATFPGVWRAFFERREAIRQTASLERLWKEVVHCFPGIAKPETETLPIRERREEMLIELEDGLTRLHLSGHATTSSQRAQDVQRALSMAEERRAVADSPAWTASRRAIVRVAAAYSTLPYQNAQAKTS